MIKNISPAFKGFFIKDINPPVDTTKQDLDILAKIESKLTSAPGDILDFDAQFGGNAHRITFKPKTGSDGERYRYELDITTNRIEMKKYKADDYSNYKRALGRWWIESSNVDAVNTYIEKILNITKKVVAEIREQRKKTSPFDEFMKDF